MKSADEIKRLFHSAAVQTNAAPDDAVFETLKTAYTRTVEHKSTQRESSMWRFVMKSPSARLASAAIVAIACLIGLSLWRGTESGIALADVLTQIDKVEAYRYQWSYWARGERDGKPFKGEEKKYTELTSPKYGYREEQLNPEVDPYGWGMGTLMYLSIPDKVYIGLWPKDKKYFRIEYDDAEMERRASDLKEGHDHPRAMVKSILECKYEGLGRSTIDGIEVEGFRTTDPNCRTMTSYGKPSRLQVDVRIWVAVKTRLPVRTEEDLDLTYGSTDKPLAHFQWHYITHGYEWNIAVEAADFKPVIPADYTLLAVFESLPPTEATAIQALKDCVDLLGNYRESLTDGLGPPQSALRQSETPAARRLWKELKGLPELDRDIKARHAFRYILWGLEDFFDGLAGKEVAYYGKTVTPQDADKVLLRWKVSDNEYRVIFGDLHAETVSPEKLAELEKALPK
jgi:hypothetical protein